MCNLRAECGSAARVTAVAIASNGTADQLIMLPKDESPHELGPAVFWWDHETGELQKIADDFSELV